MKAVLLGFGFVGALLVGAVGFNPAVAVDRTAGATAAGNEFVIVGHGGGLGPCGGAVPEAKSWLALGSDC